MFPISTLNGWSDIYLFVLLVLDLVVMNVDLG